MAEDPDRKLLDWCAHLAVPRLADEKGPAASSCKGCASKMGGLMGQKAHHCRLCGHMFCGACTGKYHVPLIFRIKNKEGPARVCMGCVDGCMREKAKAAAAAAAASKPATSTSALAPSSLATSSVSANLASLQKAVEIAPPESWESAESFVACPKCSAKKCKTHNCRVCGLQFCDKCTSKLDIPSFFEKKKGKTGPSRVCDACRFRIVSGAKLVEKLSNAPVKKFVVPPPPPAGFLAVGPGATERRASRSFANKCSTPGCMAPAAGVDGKCVSHGSPAKEEETDLATIIKREGSDAVIARITVPRLDTPLAAIDVLLKKAAPQVDAYCYVLRGEPVPDAFHKVFLARHMGRTLFIRPKRRPGVATVDEMPEEGLSALALAGGMSNPFKSDPQAEAKKNEALAAAKAREVRAASVVFKRPAVVAGLGDATGPPPGGSSSSVAASKKPPPPPPAASLGADLQGDDLFKARAKKIFGAV